MPFKCNPEIFNKSYQDHYKKRITHEFIRSSLGLPDGVRLKLNGTFERWLYLLDDKDCIYRLRYRVQTALWFNDEAGEWQYVSIFPHFIKRYCQPCLDMLEYISCQAGKGEYFYRHIDDPEGLLDCEDRITRPIHRIEKSSSRYNYPALLNSKYADVYNKPLSVQVKRDRQKQFQVLYDLIITARQFFGRQQGVLSLVNTVILL